MGRGFPLWPALVVRILLAAAASLLAMASPAAAQPVFAPGSVCHVSVAAGTSYAAAARNPAGWKCDRQSVGWAKPRQIIRFDLADRPPGEAIPRYAEFARHPLERLSVIAIAADGTMLERRYALADLAIGTSSMRSIAALPESPAPPLAIVFVLDGKYPEAIVEGELVETPSVRSTAGITHLYAALLCGLLLAPALFDFGFFRALRESFPLFHALFCVMACIQTAAVSGLVPVMAAVSYDTEMKVTYLSLDLMLAATYLFARNFIEADRLDPAHRRVLLGLVVVALVNGIATTFWTDAFGAWVDHVYFGVFVASLAAYFHVLLVASRRGSRAAPYLALGLAPLAIVQVAQSASVFVSDALTFDETWPQNLTLLFEVVATAFGVADRFMSVRRERDKALNAARILGALSERDELTGLLNRRALDIHFGELIAEGFHTLAVLDIDHFKSINDLHGHPVGDRVLCCAADALEAGDDPDARVFRIGGEEFLLLLRGTAADHRAEQRRRAISVRVASDIVALDRPVTASMGVVHFAQVVFEGVAAFSTLYSRADRLLYEAKNEGRNRFRSETLRLFEREAPATAPRRAAGAS